MKNLESEEYSRLCSEIDANSNRIFNVISIVLSAYAIILGFGISEKSGLIVLCSLLPGIPALFMIASQYSSTNRISSYLRLFYEGKESNILWETRMVDLRNDKTYKSNYHLGINMFFLIIGILAILLSLFYLFNSQTRKYDQETLNILINGIVYGFSLAVMIIGYYWGFKSIQKAKNNSEYFNNYWGKIKNNCN